MTDSNSVVDLIRPDEIDRKVLALRLAGVSIRKVARELKLTDKQVLESLDRGLPTLDGPARARYLREALAQLDELQSCWHTAARTSATAAAIVLKVAERRSALLGLDAPAHVRLDPVQIALGDRAQEGSTEALLKELERIAAERPSGGPRIEARIEAEAEPPGEPAA
jgi:hypothetical protein